MTSSVSHSMDLGGMRPMLVTDMPAVGRLFLKTFRSGTGEASADLVAYLEALALQSPVYDTEAASLVYAEPDGSISSAVISVPIRFIACEKAVTGRLMCAFMTEGPQTSGGAGALSLTLRAKRQDFAYADTASPSSLRHWRALGGQTVMLQNLRWSRTLRPIGATLDRLSQRFLRVRSDWIAVAAAPLDWFCRAAFRTIAPPPAPGLSVAPMPDERFLDLAPDFVARYAVRPEWSRQELTWLLAMARRNTTLGRLSIDAVTDAAGRTLGCCVYYGADKRTIRVLNILAIKGRENDVLAAMCQAFDRRGMLAVAGRAHPALMEGLALQAMVSFRHEAFVCMCSKHADVVEAVRRGDIYLGGLAGEGWSRLMTDFGDTQ